MDIPKIAGRKMTIGTTTFRILWFRVLCLVLITSFLSTLFAEYRSMTRATTVIPEPFQRSPVPAEIVPVKAVGKLVGFELAKARSTACFEAGKTFYEQLQIGKAQEKLQEAIRWNPQNKDARDLLKKSNWLMDSCGDEFYGCVFELSETRSTRLDAEKKAVKALFYKGERQLLRSEFKAAQKSFERVLQRLRGSPYNIDEENFEERSKIRLKCTRAGQLFTGEILYSEPTLGEAWISLGKAHEIKLGMIFEVYSSVKLGHGWVLRNGTYTPDRNGPWKLKGWVLVTNIEEHRARVKVVNTIDSQALAAQMGIPLAGREDPIVKGNVIRLSGMTLPKD